MPSLAEKPTLAPDRPLSHAHVWKRAFTAAWLLLAEGKADPEQLADRATELYPDHRMRDPAEVAREEFETEQ